MTPFDSAPITPAASLILVRQSPEGPRVLMGKRHPKSAFMPAKYVFPGGRVDPDDEGASVDLAVLTPECRARFKASLRDNACARAAGARAYLAAALRELREETGLCVAPQPHSLRFIFRAITPPGESRRFDAAFFMADAGAVMGDLDRFLPASDELSGLSWRPLDRLAHRASPADVPFITSVVLSEVAHLLAGGTQDGVPFFDNRTATARFQRIHAVPEPVG